MLQEKIRQYRAYKKLKKIAKEKLAYVMESKERLDAWAVEISRMYDTPGPYSCPTDWGTDEFPCEVVYQSQSVPCPTIFHCPYFDAKQHCTRQCAKKADNGIYFELKAIYNAFNLEYEQAVANAEAMRAKLLGRSR